MYIWRELYHVYQTLNEKENNTMRVDFYSSHIPLSFTLALF